MSADGFEISIELSGNMVVTYTYSAEHVPASQTDSYGTTSVSYDAHGHLVSVTDPRGNVATAEYAGANLISSSDPISSTNLTYGDSTQPNVPMTCS